MTDDTSTAIKPRISLPSQASMADFQTYVHELERMHGWLDVDLVHNCFLMGEEVGELFKAVRRYRRLFDEPDKMNPSDVEPLKEALADEIVDVLNYLLAIANRTDIDVEQAFRKKNAENQERTWS